MKKIIITVGALLCAILNSNGQALNGTSLTVSGAGTISSTLTVGQELTAKSATIGSSGNYGAVIGNNSYSGLSAPLKVRCLGGESGTGGPGYSGPVTKPAIEIPGLAIGPIGGALGKPFFGQNSSVVTTETTNYPDANRHITYASTNLIVAPYKAYFNYENLFDVRTGIDAAGVSILDIDKSKTVISNKVGIGTSTFPLNQEYNLYVKGGIRTEKIQVDVAGTNGWGDFVFAKSYNLMSLQETEKYISENSHLPNIPSASEIETNGLDLGEMQRLQMIKLEELTLHLIQMQKQLDALKLENESLKESK